MKRILFLSLTLLSLLGLNSCKQDIDLPNEEIPDEQFSRDKAIIAEMGFDVSTLSDEGEYYLVEGDIALEKKNIQTLTRQNYVSLISAANVKNITVGVDDSMPTSGTGNWRSEILQAIEEWNNVPYCNIHMSYTTSPSPDITIYTYTASGTTVAYAQFPWDNKAGRYIYVNSNYDHLPSATKKHTIVHEFGHNLGFGHANIGIVNNHIPETPEYDYESVMHTNVRPWTSFSYHDIYAAQYLYGSTVQTVAIEPLTPNHGDGDYYIYQAKITSGTGEIEKVEWNLDVPRHLDYPNTFIDTVLPPNKVDIYFSDSLWVGDQMTLNAKVYIKGRYYPEYISTSYTIVIGNN